MTRVALALPLLLALSLPVIGCGSSDNGSSPGGDGGSDVAVSTDTSTGGSDATQGAETGTSSSLDGGIDADAWTPLPPTPATPELWYWHHSYLSPTSTTEPAASEAL